MDPFTHMLTGAAIADACSAGKRLGRGAVTFAALLAAAPDVDVIPAVVVAFPSNPFSRDLLDTRMLLAVHRGYTHAFPVLACAALLAGLVVRAGWGREKSWLRWAVLAAAALFSHSLTDMLNGAVRAWLPFSPDWIGWGQSPEADPLILAILCLCFLANHPLHFENKHGLATLAALERLGRWVQGYIGRRINSRLLAAGTLAVVAIIMIVRRGG